MTRFTGLVFLLFSVLMARAQADSIILLNGKVYRGEITSADNGILTYKESSGKHSGELNEITFDRLFSYTSSGKETIVYAQNEFIGDFLTVEEAKRTTLGSYDARHTFKPRFVFYSSLALGLGVSLLDTYYTQKAYDRFLAANGNPPSNATVGFFGAPPTAMPILVPVVLSVGWAIPSFRVKGKQILQKSLKGDESYYRGYHRIAKQKRIFAAISGSAIGIGAGFIGYAIFTPN